MFKNFQNFLFIIPIYNKMKSVKANYYKNVIPTPKTKNSIKNRNKTKVEEYIRFLNSGLVFRINNKYKDFDFIEQLDSDYKKEYCGSVTELFKNVRNVN